MLDEPQAKYSAALKFESEGNVLEARRLLAEVARSGHTDAMYALAKNLLTQQPLVPNAGVSILKDAADHGNAEAEHMFAVVASRDWRSADNWSIALDYLMRSAEHGSEQARAQLELLADLPENMASEADDPDVWRHLRQRIDIGKWLETPTGRVVFDTPRVVVVENFAPARICDWLIESSRPRLERPEISNRFAGQVEDDPDRWSNSVTRFNLAQYDVVLALLQARIATFAGVTTDDLEPPLILHYAQGQQFAEHFDFLDPSMPTTAREIARNGQRVATFLLYMNDGSEGGETEFPRLDWRFKGKKGDALLFWSVDPSGKPDETTLHAGTPVAAGEKWAVSQWIRRKPR